jgi:hypothetical protein
MIFVYIFFALLIGLCIDIKFIDQKSLGSTVVVAILCASLVIIGILIGINLGGK